MHLAEDTIPLGLCITGQEVPRLLVRLGNCLVMTLLGFLEHLLSLLNLHLVGLNINVHQDSVLQTRSFKEILQHARLLFNSLGKHPTLLACSHGSIWACCGGTCLEACPSRIEVLPWA
jgi:hypothetical protein